MKAIYFISLLLLATVAQLAEAQDDKDCAELRRRLMSDEAKDDDLATGTPCRDPCDEDGNDITDEVNCTSVGYCTWFGTPNNSCLIKTVEVSAEARFTATSGLNVTSALPLGLTSTGTGSTDSGNEAEGRFFQGGAAPPPGFPVPQLQGFPYNCGINPNDPIGLQRLLVPPVNIPYCLRIPCSRSDPSLEFNRDACIARPGCYFDYELANIRRFKGHSVLPGVPVCHLVIRSSEFQKLAESYMSKNGGIWHALLTKCFLREHGKVIYVSPCGCQVIYALRYFGIWPKRLHWTGIMKSDCYLLNGCWINNYCYIPASSGKIQIRSGIDRHRRINSPGVDIYGQPLCHPFDINAKPAEFLDNFHKCKVSGCVLDPLIDRQYVQAKFCDIAKSDLVPSCYKVKFWNGVLRNKIRPDNWREELDKIKSCNCPIIGPVAPVIPSFSTNPFSLDVNQRSSTGDNATARFASSFGGFFGPNYLQGCTVVPGIPNLPPGIGNPFSQPGQPIPNSLSPQPNSFGIGNPFNPSGQGQGFGIPGTGQGFVPPGPGFGFPPNPYQPPLCPYRPYNLPGYPLSGSFAGCCERNYCYHPRSQLDTQFSGESPYFYLWGAWDQCTKSCGGGRRKRNRYCVRYRGGKCEGEDAQNEVCGDGPCPYWTKWGKWGPCSVACGVGEQWRTRKCRPNDQGCPGKARDKRECRRPGCPVFEPWKPWTDCKANTGRCGPGTQKRSRECSRFCEGVSPDQLEEVKSCTVYCGRCDVIASSPCTWNFGVCSKPSQCRYQGGRGWCLHRCQQKLVACGACSSFVQG